MNGFRTCLLAGVGACVLAAGPARADSSYPDKDPSKPRTPAVIQNCVTSDGFSVQCGTNGTTVPGSGGGNSTVTPAANPAVALTVPLTATTTTPGTTARVAVQPGMATLAGMMSGLAGSGATLGFMGSKDGGASYGPINCLLARSADFGTSIASTGTQGFSCPVAGLSNFGLIVTTAGSGSATATGAESIAPHTDYVIDPVEGTRADALATDPTQPSTIRSLQAGQLAALLAGLKLADGTVASLPSGTAAGAYGPVVDGNGYGSIAWHLTNIPAGASIGFQNSPDGATNWQTETALSVPTGAMVTSTGTTPGEYRVASGSRYHRLLVQTYTSGTIAGAYQQKGSPRPAPGVVQDPATALLALAARLNDAASTALLPRVQSHDDGLQDTIQTIAITGNGTYGPFNVGNAGTVSLQTAFTGSTIGAIYVNNDGSTNGTMISDIDAPFNRSNNGTIGGANVYDFKATDNKYFYVVVTGYTAGTNNLIINLKPQASFFKGYAQIQTPTATAPTGGNNAITTSATALIPAATNRKRLSYQVQGTGAACASFVTTAVTITLINSNTVALCGGAGAFRVTDGTSFNSQPGQILPNTALTVIGSAINGGTFNMLLSYEVQ